MNKTKLAAIAATLVLALIGPASMAGAWSGHGGGYGYGGYPGDYGYCPGMQTPGVEQRALNSDFNKKAAPLVAQLRAKQAELDALYAQGRPETAKTRALVKEIDDLQGRLYRLEAKFGTQMRNNGGYTDGAYGWGHRGGWGHGGRHGGRYGGGHCW